MFARLCSAEHKRMAKLRKTAAGTERLAEAEAAFDFFCKAAVKKKKAVANDKADERDFESGLYHDYTCQKFIQFSKTICTLYLSRLSRICLFSASSSLGI